MNGWQVDHTTEGFQHPDQPPAPEPVAVSEEQAEYAAATAAREETRRHHW